MIKKLEPTTGCLQETRFGAKDTQRLKVSGERPREPVLCPSDPRCSRGPRSLAWMFHLASDQGSQEPWLATYFAAPNMGPVPFWGKDLGPSGTMECSCPWVTSGHLNPLFQHHRIEGCLPGPGGLNASLRQCLPLPFVLSLSWNLSLSVLPSQEWTSGSYSIPPLSLWNLLLLAGDGQRWSGSPHTAQTPVQRAPPRRLRRVTEVPPSGRIVAASLTVAIFSPLFPATKRCPAEDRMKWQTAIYYIHYIYYILRG